MVLSILSGNSIGRLFINVSICICKAQHLNLHLFKNIKTKLNIFNSVFSLIPVCRHAYTRLKIQMVSLKFNG